MNLWLKLWNMLTMTGVSPYWQVLWTTKPTAISMRLLPRDIKFISIRVPASCADWTVRATWRTLSTPALPITVTMTIARTAWQWTWFVPHDVDGLVELMGGRDAFIGKLDSLFTADSKLEGESTSVDISGLIGQYAHGNEPSHHIAHLYNYVGQPWRTQEIVDEVLHTLYFNNPDGLSGNEDCGQMSAWYILNAMASIRYAPASRYIPSDARCSTRRPFI